MAVGVAWLQGVCVVASVGMHACGGAWLGGVQGCGGCVVGGCIGYDEIWSMSGRYASYWNAFLFIGRF